MDCSGTRIGNTPRYCSHSNDAGVRCPPPTTCTTGDIRLRGGSTPNEGRVEICQFNIWGTICNDLWALADAVVTCKQLGYNVTESSGNSLAI